MLIETGKCIEFFLQLLKYHLFSFVHVNHTIFHTDIRQKGA